MTDRLYLFGDAHPGMSALVGNQDFRRLVRDLYLAGMAPLPPNPSEQVAEALEQAVDCELFHVTGAVYRRGPALVPIPASAEGDLPRRIRPALAHYVEIAEEVSAELRSLYESTAARERFDWSEVSHSFVAGLLLDLAMGQAVVTSGQIRRLPSGDSVIWAFEKVSADNAFGVQWTPGGPRSFYAQLWHSNKIHRPVGQLMVPVAKSLVQVASGQEVEMPKNLLFLRYLKLLRKVGSGWELGLPVFGPEDVRRLLPVLVEGGRRLVDDAVVPALERIAEHPWWRSRIEKDAYRHAAVRLVLEYGTDCVIAAGVLDAFPPVADLDASWGRWLWTEPDEELSLMPNLVAGEEEAR